MPAHAHAIVPLADYLAKRRALVEEALVRYLPAPPHAPAVLFEATRYSLLAGGKRLRPLLTLAAAEAVAGDDASHACDLALPAACAIEMIHTYSLIHDDLPAMDDDSLRRGQPTSHVKFGEGMAILAGDGLLTEAFALLAHEPPAAADDVAIGLRKLRTIALVATAAGIAGMVGGQAIDLHAARPHGVDPASADGRRAAAARRTDDSEAAYAASGGLAGAPDAIATPPPKPGSPASIAATFTAEALRDMHARKTGALIRAAALAGAMMAGASPAAEAAIDGFATNLGLAFQIVDDILDVEGTDQSLGKTAGKDAAAGKPTYPALFGLAESKRLARDAVDRAHAALATAGITGRLPEIAEWVVGRQN
jgi:geranylgeranyl diphosphate synthase type II